MAELTPESKTVIKQGRALEGMVATEGWKVYQEILQAQVDHAATEAMSGSGGLDGMIQKEGAKGVFRGLRLALTLPQVTIAAMKELLGANNEG